MGRGRCRSTFRWRIAAGCWWRADGTMERTAYGPEDGVLFTHGPGEDGFLRRWETALEWKTAD